MNRRRFLGLLGIAPVVAPAALQAAAMAAKQPRFDWSEVTAWDHAWVEATSAAPGFIIDGRMTAADAELLSMHVRPVQQAADKLQRLLPDEVAADVVGVDHYVFAGEPLDVVRQIGEQSGPAVALGPSHSVQEGPQDDLHRHVIGPEPRDVGLIISGQFGSPFIARAA